MFVIAHARKQEQVRRWFAKNMSQKEYEVRRNGEVHLYCSASKPKVVDHAEGGEFSLGHLVDHAARTVQFAPFSGPIRAPKEGSFFSAHWSGGRVSLCADVFGLVPILVFSSPDLCVFSDSLFAVTQVMRAAQVQVELDCRAFISRAEPVTITGQTVSTRTFIRSVAYAPPGTEINVAIEPDRMVATMAHEGFYRLFAPSCEPYHEQLRAAAERAIGYVGALISVPDIQMKMDLSGGMDSRLCLAFALKVEGAAQRIVIGSARHRPNEFAVAKNVCESLGLSLNPARGVGQVIPADQWANWLTACAGVYDPMFGSSVVRKEDNVVMVGGHGAGVYKGAYDWRQIRAIGHGFDPEVRRLFHEEVSEALSVVGVDPDGEFGSEWQYLGWRNAIHGGRFLMTASLGVRPILSRELVGLAHQVDVVSGQRAHRRIIRDMLIYVNPELASMDFSDPRKNIPGSTIDRVSDEGAGAELRAHPYHVEGRADLARIRPIVSLNEKAQELGFTGEFRAGDLVKKASLYRHLAPREIHRHVERLFAFGIQGTGDPIEPSARPNMALSKIVSLALLAH